MRQLARWLLAWVTTIGAERFDGSTVGPFAAMYYATLDEQWPRWWYDRL